MEGAHADTGTNLHSSCCEETALTTALQLLEFADLSSEILKGKKVRLDSM